MALGFIFSSLLRTPPPTFDRAMEEAATSDESNSARIRVDGEGEDGTDEDGTSTPGPVPLVRILYKLKRNSLRSAVASFGHSYVCESIPVAILPSAKHERASVELVVALDRFTQCKHYGKTNDDGVCGGCAAQLYRITHNHMNLLPSVVRLVNAIVEAQAEGDDTKIRALAMFTASMIRQLLDVLAGSRALYAEKQTQSAKSYTASYRVVGNGSTTIVQPTSPNARPNPEEQTDESSSHNPAAPNPSPAIPKALAI